MPFKHDIAGGQGNLVVPAVKSPNFVHGLTGWSINKDGSAEFHDVSLPAGSGGAVVTFSSTAPGSPNVGDVWYDTAAGLEANQWNGTSWVPYQIGTGAIGSGAVTGTQLAASVTARALGGVTTTISSTAPSSPLAGDLWIDSAAGYQIQQYSGSAWTAVQWNAHNVLQAGTVTATEIHANTITASQLAAGIVYAGIVNGTTINGGTLVISQGSGATFEQVEIDGATGAITWSKYQSPTVVIRKVLGNGTDLTYADPGSGGAQGGLVASYSTVSGTDVISGQTYQAGYFLYETTGNGMAGLMWNTATGTLPLLALYPDSAFGFTGNAPYILARDANKGLTSEYVSLELGSGNPPSPHTSANSKIILWSGSPDTTTSVPHVWVAGGNSSNMIIDITPTGVNAANPSSTNVTETWHPMTLVNGWANHTGQVTAQYRKIASPPNSVEIIGALDATAATAGTIFTLPAGYRPTHAQGFAMGATAGVPTGDTSYIFCDNLGNLSMQRIALGVADTYTFHGTIALDA